MIYVGLDDTDIVDSPGTNQLARRLVHALDVEFIGRLIVRHQLLDDPRVPYTSQNGCASLMLEPRGTYSITQLVDTLRQEIIAWCPAGSDPGLCVTEHVPGQVMEFGLRCQRELIRQRDARDLAARAQLHLEGLGGTEDGVIGALAAVGLLAGGDDGRVIHLGDATTDLYDVSGWQAVEFVRSLGVAEVRELDTGRAVTAGLVDVGKRLRPNLRGGRAVVFVTPVDTADDGLPRWQAVRLK